MLFSANGRIDLFRSLAVTALIAVCRGQGDPVIEKFRLPRNVIPTKQNLVIYTNLGETYGNFWGNTTVEIRCLAETQQIILHASHLTISDTDVVVSAINADGTLSPLQVADTDFDEEYEFFIINLAKSLVVERLYTVDIAFAATLEAASSGYVRTSYVDAATGKIRWFASTYLRPGYARRVFPCLDQSDMKTIFSICLGHTNDLTAISNMPVTDSYAIDGWDGWIMDVFEDTPPMASFLVAILISSFEHIEVPDTRIPLRIWAPTNSIDNLEIVQKSAASAVSFYEETFALKYPLPKLDIVSVPHYVGSMESFGCVMINEDTIRYDPVTATYDNPIEIVVEVGRLIAFQWLDGVVTFPWWSETWIAGSFVYYFNIFFDLENYNNVRFTSVYLNVLHDEAMFLNTYPLVRPISSPTNLSQNWNTATFRKGYFLVKMLNMILGYDAFMAGVRTYLRTYQHGVASQNDLLQVLNQEGMEAETLHADMDLKQIMRAWTRESGYPVIKVTIDHAEHIATLSQTRFLSEPGLSAQEWQQSRRQCWSIPISYTTSVALNFDDTLPCVYVTCEQNGCIALNYYGDEDWLIINLKAIVLVRVNYDRSNWLALQNTLRDPNAFAAIDVMNRMQLVGDSFELAWPAELSYEIPIGIAPYLKHEFAEQPWRIGLESLRNVRIRLKKTNLIDTYHQFVRTFLEPKFLQLGPIDVIPSSILRARFKLLINSWACTYAIQNCLEQCLNVLMQWYNSEEPDSYNPVPIDVRNTVYCYGIQEGDINLWYFMFDRFLNATDPVEKNRILSGLGCSTSHSLLLEYLLRGLCTNEIEIEYRVSIFHSVVSSNQRFNFALLLNFLAHNFVKVCQILGTEEILCELIRAVGELIDTPEELQQYKTFLDSIYYFVIKSCRADIDSALRTATNNIAWHELHDQELMKIFGI